VIASDLNELYAEAAGALFALLVHDLDAVRPLQTIDLQLTGADRELLLRDWLDELLFLFESRQLLLSEFDVIVEPTGLSAQMRGEIYDTQRHELGREVKAITYHGLTVRQDQDRWLAEVIVDI
jgi:SHS2 domain-containing protein